MSSESVKLDTHELWNHSYVACQTGTFPSPQTADVAWSQRVPSYGPLAIIEHLTAKCGGNVHDKGIVNVTAGSAACGAPPKNAADLRTDSVYWSLYEENPFICYDFKDLRVIPHKYILRSDQHDQPMSWVVEVSDDGTENSWTEIDRRDSNDNLKGKYVTRKFKIPHIPSRGFRFFRLRQTGPNHYGYDDLVLTTLEIIGTLSY